MTDEPAASWIIPEFKTTRVEQLITAQARATPDAVAVVCGDRRIRYRELEQLANAVAAELRDRGVGGDRIVAVCIDRSVEMVVGVLAALKAGGGYLPIDPADPAERIAILLDGSAAGAVLTRRGALSAAVRAACAGPHARWVVDVDDDRAACADAPSLAHDDRALAYAIFTSGSTGKPKGVAMTHAPLLELLRWQRHSTTTHRIRAAAVRPDLAECLDHTLQFTPLTFDVSFLEIFSALVGGATVIVPTEAERRDFAVLLELIDRHEVASLFLPLVALNQIAEAGLRWSGAASSLVEIMTGGEQLRITPAIAAWFRRMPQCTLQNIYGPTEAHVVATHGLFGDPDQWPALPPIGRPIPSAELFLLDPERHPVPTGEIGELYIGGRCLAREYLGRPDLTAERFVANPFGPGRLYRTGDLAHVLPDGALMYDGRVDDQVKIDGVRVELGEIESVLARHPDVAMCSVVADQDASGSKRLIAYVVPRSAPPATPVTVSVPASLSDHLAAHLPQVMVPRTFVLLRELPTTTSGKIDRKALPPASSQRPVLQTAFAPPSSPIESMIATFWRELLRLDQVGIDDGFFELGGRSLVLVQVQNRLTAELGREIPFVALFEHSTVRGLARFLSEAHEEVTPPPDAAGAAERQARRSQFLRRGRA